MMLSHVTYQLGSFRETLQDLQKANPDWDTQKIYDKTGIDVRYLSTPDETALSLATKAAQALLDECNESIDGLVYVTQSPDSLIPGTAFLLHEALCLPKTCFVYEVNHGCSGFVYGLALALGQLSLLNVKRCLLVCSEVYTKYIGIADRTCRPLFSDGASAALVTYEDLSNIGPFIFYTDGAGVPDLRLSSIDGRGPSLFMNGANVLLFTIEHVPKAVHALLKRAKLNMEEIDLFIFHQASKVVLDNIQATLNISKEKFFRCDPLMGNTVSSTIPIALKEARDTGRIRDGMKVMLVGFGVGYSLAACVLTI